MAFFYSEYGRFLMTQMLCSQYAETSSDLDLYLNVKKNINKIMDQNTSSSYRVNR